MAVNESSPHPISADWIGQWFPQRDRIVSALALTADGLTGASRRRVRRLADDVAYCQGVDDVLVHPIALEIFLCLAGRSQETGAGSSSGRADASSSLNDVRVASQNLDTKIGLAVHRVLLAHSPADAGRRHLGTLLAYPLMVLSIWYLVMAGVSILLVPMFRTMFDEFGLTLPWVTKLLFGIADAIGSPLTYVWIFLFFALLMLFAWVQWGPQWASRGGDTSANFRGGTFRSTRGAWADWAWHVSLLLRAGLEFADAIALAGDASARTWLQQGSHSWAVQVRSGERPFQGVTHFRGVPCHLLADALSLDSREIDQAGMLRAVAEIYWDRDQQRSAWRLGCLAPVIAVGVMGVVLASIYALFSPLVQLISGLS